jgi:hypothetical protein
MAKAKATAETLTQFSSTLKSNHDDILAVKSSMDKELQSFIWDDPVGASFRAKYYEDLKPIEGKLIPNLEAYSAYLDQEAALVTEFGKD